MLTIPENELVFECVHGNGPGGQGVNTSSSAVQLRFSLAATAALPPEAVRRLKRLAGRKVNAEGELVICAAEFRSQRMNRLAARERLYALVARALEPPKPRKKTTVPAVSRRERLENKRRRAILKQSRNDNPSTMEE